jgi:Secretion system C-terminal sorting domain
MKRIITLVILLVAITFSKAQIKILFDATKAEMAGNGDWVIDADLHNLKANSNGTVTVGGSDSNPQKTPTPAQSGITASTSETYWTGALSAWAVDLVKRGYIVETLPYNAIITYGDPTNVQDLSNYKVYIIDEPNLKFTTSEANALINFVNNGGGLFMISDHDVSDRNGDGWDSPGIWNDILSNNTIQTNPFGITFDLQNISQTSTNIANLPTDPILHGSAGTPTQIQFSNGTTMTLNKAANPSVKGLIFKTGSSTTGTTNVLFATATYGLGKVCALGDSSVPDDGTGDPGDTLYNGYTGDANGNHKPLLLNATIWLATSSSNLNINDLSYVTGDISIYPNPASDYIYISTGKDSNNYQYSITDFSGRNLETGIVTSGKINVEKYNSGTYILTVKSASNSTKSFKFIKK